MYKLLLCWRYLRTRYLALVCIISVMLGVGTLIVSPIAFYQMLGRGTRIDEPTGKLVFTVYDYTGATRLFGEEFVTKPRAGGGGGDGEKPPPPLPDPKAFVGQAVREW